VAKGGYVEVNWGTLAGGLGWGGSTNRRGGRGKLFRLWKKGTPIAPDASNSLTTPPLLMPYRTHKPLLSRGLRMVI